MLLWKKLWRDDAGVVLSAEAVLVGSLVAVGAVAGLSTINHSVDGELQEVGFAIRSLDQSYVYNGHLSSVAWTAGSYFSQPAIEISHADLGARVDADVKAFQERVDAYRKRTDSSSDKAEQPAKEKKREKRRRMKKAVQIDESAATSARPNDLPAQEE